MENDKNSGITLIALVITIIVLLILAGISISMVVVKNGVIEKSMNAKEKSIYADAKERVLMEVEGSYDKTGKINLEDLNKNLRENLDKVELKGEDGTYSVLTDSNKIENLPSIVKYNGYDVEIDGYIDDSTQISQKGKLKKPESDDKILEIGDVTVNDNKLNFGWKYFCQDEDNYYFIYEDFLETSAIPDPDRTSNGGNIVVVKDSGLWSLAGSSEVQKNDLLNYLSGVGDYEGIWDYITEGIKSALREKGISEEELSKIETTGTPTKEQFADAYNERYAKTKDDRRLEVTGQGSRYEYDYSFELPGKKSFRKSLDMQKENSEAYNNSLLFPHPGDNNGFGGYWLGSASNTMNYVCLVGCWCGKLMTNEGRIYVGIRPLVKIPKTLFE